MTAASDGRWFKLEPTPGTCSRHTAEPKRAAARAFGAVEDEVAAPSRRLAIPLVAIDSRRFKHHVDQVADGAVVERIVGHVLFETSETTSRIAGLDRKLAGSEVLETVAATCAGILLSIAFNPY